jgi:hypothetical protein
VTQQFLDDFGVLSIGIQDRAKGMTKRMPTDSFLQTNLLSRALDVNAIDRIWPVGCVPFMATLAQTQCAAAEFLPAARYTTNL